MCRMTSHKKSPTYTSMTKKTEGQLTLGLSIKKAKGMARASWCGERALQVNESTKAAGTMAKHKALAISEVDLEGGCSGANSRATRRLEVYLFRCSLPPLVTEAT